MAEDRKHEIIEINKMENLTNSYFVRRGIIFSRDCDNNRLNVWIEGTLFENLEIFYHCENETESTPDKAFDLFEVGRKVLVLHKFIYQGEGSEKVEKIERTVIGLKYNSPEGISNLQPCVVKRFFAKVRKEIDASVSYFYYWICIDSENNITILEINDNEDKTETEVFYEMGFIGELEKALYLGDPSLNPLTQSATKSFMMTNDNGFRERWVATPCSLFKDQCEVINIIPELWSAPPPCDVAEMPCPPNRFYCDTENRILVWYGAYEIFIGATVIRFDTDTNYTWNCVAASGSAIVADAYQTLTGTKEDIPINMISDVESVTDTEISFYLPRILPFDRPGLVTIDWINYVWGPTISAVGVEETKHWYWNAEGFEQKICALFDQTDLSGSIIDEIESYENNACFCNSITTQAECEACNEIIQKTGTYKRTVNQCDGYISLYDITIFDELFEADTTYRNLGIWEGKIYTAGQCVWNGTYCGNHATIGYNAARRSITEQLEQKHTNGLSAFWNSNNVAYFFKEQNRHKCVGSANQKGKICAGSFGSVNCIYWGGINQADFCNCCWRCDWPAFLCAENCPDGLGKCFEIDMPGDDWLGIENDYVETLAGPTYKWHRNSNNDSYAEPLVRKFRIDEEIEFDATEIYKTYYLDDRATCHEQGLMVAGKGVRSGEFFWEIYHDGIDITAELFEALSCEQSELDEIGLI